MCTRYFSEEINLEDRRVTWAVEQKYWRGTRNSVAQNRNYEICTVREIQYGREYILVLPSNRTLSSSLSLSFSPRETAAR